MGMSCELTLEVVYYNEQLAVCEPLIEPVETDIGHRPWQISFAVSYNHIRCRLADQLVVEFRSCFNESVKIDQEIFEVA